VRGEGVDGEGQLRQLMFHLAWRAGSGRASSRRRLKLVSVARARALACSRPAPSDAAGFRRRSLLACKVLRRVLHRLCQPVELLASLVELLLDLTAQARVRRLPAGRAARPARERRVRRRRSGSAPADRRRSRRCCKSVSWPIPQITGSEQARMARATASSLNAQRSSMLPPPRQTISNSHSRRSPAARMASAICVAAPSPCTGVG
jgi:hypothetical protein